MFRKLESDFFIWGKLNKGCTYLTIFFFLAWWGNAPSPLKKGMGRELFFVLILGGWDFHLGYFYQGGLRFLTRIFLPGRVEIFTPDISTREGWDFHPGYFYQGGLSFYHGNFFSGSFPTHFWFLHGNFQQNLFQKVFCMEGRSVFRDPATDL